MRSVGLPTPLTIAPNLAPMVDVVMVILIYFMLGTTVSTTEGALPTRLPSDVGPGGGAAVTIIPAVRIALLEQPDGKSCKIIVMEHELAENTFDALSAFLKQKRVEGADPSGRVLLEAQPTVRYQDVISAMDAAVRGGFGNIQFAVSGKQMAPVQSGETR